MSRTRRFAAVVLMAVVGLGASARAAENPYERGPTEASVVAAAAPEVRGYVDLHTHMMSYEGFGGEIICGAPFHQEGIEKALRDCPHHEPDGALALFENLTTNGSPFGTHDPKGWPTFKYWPNNRTATHQQVYYKWLERSWKAGQRILVNQLVTNRILCEIYPAKKYPCEEMGSIRLQAQRTYELQDYIDKEYGGPGKGWYRVVRDPVAARKVIQEGKLAVVLGIETSEPLGCRGSELFPGCTTAQIDKGLDEMRDLGVSSMFLCHKFDNALCGVRFDSGVLGVALNGGNILSSGHNWQAETCKPGAISDNTIPSIFLKAPHCNRNGLTRLGEYMVKAMMKRGMIIELDHMSAKAAGQTLTLLEQAGYPGVVASHSWADGSYHKRVYKLGGMVTAMGDAAPGFTRQWSQDKALRDPDRLFGYGYGLDANGVATLPSPRPGGDLKYPFTSPFDPSVSMDRLTTGERTWDLNKEGVANYGLVPDWLADIANVSGPEIINDLSLGAEVYLRMWAQAQP